MPPKKEGAGPTKEEILARQLEEEKRKRDTEFERKKRSRKGEKEDGREERLSVGEGNPDHNSEELTGIVGAQSHVPIVHVDTGSQVTEGDENDSSKTEWDIRDSVEEACDNEVASIDSNLEKGEKLFENYEGSDSNNDFSHDESEVHSSDRGYDSGEGDGYEADVEVGFGERRRDPLERRHRDSREVYRGSTGSGSEDSRSRSSSSSSDSRSYSSSSEESGVFLGREELGEGLNVGDDRIPEAEQPQQGVGNIPVAPAHQPDPAPAPGRVARLLSQCLERLFGRH